MDNVAMDLTTTTTFSIHCLYGPRRLAEMLLVFGSWVLPSRPGGLYLCTRLGGLID